MILFPRGVPAGLSPRRPGVRSKGPFQVPVPAPVPTAPPESPYQGPVPWPLPGPLSRPFRGHPAQSPFDMILPVAILDQRRHLSFKRDKCLLHRVLASREHRTFFPVGLLRAAPLVGFAIISNNFVSARLAPWCPGSTWLHGAMGPID